MAIDSRWADEEVPWREEWFNVTLANGKKLTIYTVTSWVVVGTGTD